MPEPLILDLAVRLTGLRGICTIHLLSELMKVPLELAESIFRKLNDQQYLEVRRMDGDDYVFSLSPSGRKLAGYRWYWFLWSCT